MHDRSRTPARALKWFTRIGAATLAALGLALGVASPALAHDELLNTGFEYHNSTGEFDALTLLFSNSIMEVGTEILVTDQNGASVASGAPELSGPSVRQALNAPLTVGAYQAVWRVVSSDGHPIQGSTFFEVTDEGKAEFIALGADDPRFSKNTNEDEGSATEQPTLDATQTDEEQSSGSFPVGGWIAVAAILVLGVGAGLFFATRKRTQGN